MDIEEQVQIEDNIIRLISSAWSMYDQLPELHPMDKRAFQDSLHRAQSVILARPKIRGIMIARSGQVPQQAESTPSELNPSKLPVPPGQKAAKVVSGGTASLPPIQSPAGIIK